MNGKWKLGISLLIFVLSLVSSASSSKQAFERKLWSDLLQPPMQKQCVMYGVCGNDPDDDSKALNCAYNGPPVPTDDDNLQTLQIYCPELVQEYGNNFCCAADQIVDLVSNLALPRGIIGECPSCYHNFRQMFCHLACSPYQAQFMHANETVTVEDKTMVRKLDVMVTEEYVTKTYDSCKNVIMSSTSGPAMDFLCGPWGALECSPQRWFDYLGSVKNGFSPFSIRFNYISNGEEIADYIPFNYPTVSCDQIAPNSNSPCSCLDCPSSPKCPPYERECVMFDKCGHQPESEHDALNCVYHGAPEQFQWRGNDDLYYKFKFYCPEILTEYGPNLCCSASQMKDLVNTMSYYHGILGDCPSCWHNFRQLQCNIVCSPYQQVFLRVNETIRNPVTNRELVKKLDVYVADNYLKDTFESCKTLITNSPIGVPVELVCGRRGSRCTADEWFSFMGRYSLSPRDTYTSYDIEFVEIGNSKSSSIRTNDVTDVIIPFNVTTLTCSQIPPIPPVWNNENWGQRTQHVCSCESCEAMCSAESIRLTQ